MLPVQPRAPVDLPGTDPVGISARDEAVVPIPMSPTQRHILPGLAQPFLAVLADGLQQPVPHHPVILLRDQNGLVDQGSHQIEYVFSGELAAAADRPPPPRIPSTASSRAPPAKTASRAQRVRSSGEHRS